MNVKSDRRPRVLVVDDDDDLTRSMRILLERAGFEVELASNGARALEVQRNFPAHVLITDIFMPEMDGLETIQQFRQEFPAVKIVAMSGASGRTDYLLTAGTAGAGGTLQKPFTEETLLQALRKVAAAH